MKIKKGIKSQNRHHVAYVQICLGAVVPHNFLSKQIKIGHQIEMMEMERMGHEPEC
jgi:hypothetical protein